MKLTTNCTIIPKAQLEDLELMIEEAREISLEEFATKAEGLEDWKAEHGYDETGENGIPLATDWAVSFYASEFGGKPCVFMDWSCIEFVWT